MAIPNPKELEDPKAFRNPVWIDRIAEMTLDDLLYIDRESLYRPCVDRLKNLQQWLERTFVGKNELIELMLICTIAQLPMLLLGTWGTGKSLLVRKLVEGLGISLESAPIRQEGDFLQSLLDPKTAGTVQNEMKSRQHFEYLVTRFTTPEELLGPANIELMLSRAVYLRQSSGLLPQAEFAFLDEIFKANSSILNALLAIINERLYHNAGRTWKVNLIMVFGASNERPEEEELGAFYDRFPIRAVCDRVANDDLSDMLEKSHVGRFSQVFPVSAAPEDPLPCVNDFRLLHKLSLAKFGGKELTNGANSREFLERFTSLFQFLRWKYDLSDRSFGQYYLLARARALLKGRNELSPEDGKILTYCGKDAVATGELRNFVEDTLGEVS